MKTLYLIRHAKSSWDQESLDDFQRPLNKRGREDAPRMASLLEQHALTHTGSNLWRDSVWVSSTANRAASTASIFAEVCNKDIDTIEFRDDLYLPTERSMLTTIASTQQSSNVLLLFSHNPSITSLANYLSNESLLNIPTCGIVCIDFAVEDWNNIAVGTGTLVAFLTPRTLTETP